MTTTREDVVVALSGVEDPMLERPMADLDLLRAVDIDGAPRTRTDAAEAAWLSRR